MGFDLDHIELQLQKRWAYPYRWGRKQNDQWDAYTAYIYNTPEWEHLIDNMKKSIKTHQLNKKDLFYYAANRWYNFWSARAVEKIFAENREVIPAKNPKDRQVDFTCGGIDFDHKTSVFPKGFRHSIGYAQSHKKELITWFYNNQSQQQRQHFKNRLFLVVYAEDGEHWKLKARLHWLKIRIEAYLRDFDRTKLLSFNFHHDETTFADVIWAVHS